MPPCRRNLPPWITEMSHTLMTFDSPFTMSHLCNIRAIRQNIMAITLSLKCEKVPPPCVWDMQHRPSLTRTGILSPPCRPRMNGACVWWKWQSRFGLWLQIAAGETVVALSRCGACIKWARVCVCVCVGWGEAVGLQCTDNSGAGGSGTQACIFIVSLYSCIIHSGRVFTQGRSFRIWKRLYIYVYIRRERESSAYIIGTHT